MENYNKYIEVRGDGYNTECMSLYSRMERVTYIRPEIYWEFKIRPHWVFFRIHWAYWMKSNSCFEGGKMNNNKFPNWWLVICERVKTLNGTIARSERPKNALTKFCSKLIAQKLFESIQWIRFEKSHYFRPDIHLSWLLCVCYWKVFVAEKLKWRSLHTMK